MAQISKGDTFVDGQQVTGVRLNQLVDSAVLLVGSISDQTAIAANGVAAGDELVINDGGVLKKATAGDILNSGLNTTFGTCNSTTTVTSQINGQTNADIVQTPNDGTLVTGKSFTSIDGINVVVTSIAHGLQSNSLVEFTASDAVYSGQYYITVISVDSFSYVISQTNPTASSGTVDYTKKGTVKVAGNQHISQNLGVGGYINVSGKITANNNLVVNGSLTSSGTANFTGAFQFNGTAVYGLAEIVEEDIPYTAGATANTLYSLFTSASYTKPAGEIWVVEVDAYIYAPSNSTNIHYRVTDAADSVNYTSGYLCNSQTNSVWLVSRRMYLDTANTHTGVFHFRTKASQNNVAIAPTSTQLTAYPDSSKGTVNKFRIYKYKTA